MNLHFSLNKNNLYRTHNCGELRLKHLNTRVRLSGWVDKIRDKGFMIWIDLRDREGLTQLIVDSKRTKTNLLEQARKLGREFVISAYGKVIERESKNSRILTGDIEILVEEINVLNASKIPPFTIEENTDGGEEIRMSYRYLDLRRKPLKENILLRYKTAMAVRDYLLKEGFIEIETPYLIKSTPEGARDFIVPSRVNKGEFYALPQSPQTFKQLLMVSGFDRYFQIARCFRDEDLRADRQLEFTQIDCEMSFVTREDVLNTFENFIQSIFKQIKGIKLPNFERITHADALSRYGTDKPDLRFDMRFHELNSVVKNSGFRLFDQSKLVVGFVVPNGATLSKNKIDSWIKWIRRSQIGASGITWLKYDKLGKIKSSVDKFFSHEQLSVWIKTMKAKPNDLIIVMAGDSDKTREQLGVLRTHIADTLGWRDSNVFCPLWVTDFPLLEWNEETKRYDAMHHPFTSPHQDCIDQLNENPKNVLANSYDLVINGYEIGGGSIRIHDRAIQEKVFNLLGFSPKEAKKQFGFLIDALEYGAPPHGGIAFGFDRLVAILGGSDRIRDFIPFPKNNQGRDSMINSPSIVEKSQLDELGIQLIFSTNKSKISS